MNWTLELTEQALRDLKRLKEPARGHAVKAMRKVAQNPLPASEGGYGKPLGNRNSASLTGYMKIKLRGDGIRIVYRLECVEGKMVVIVIEVRDDDYVYEEAARRIRNGLA